MTKTIKIFVVLLFTFLLNGCISNVDRVTKARLEVNPAPEMGGAGFAMDTTSLVRVSANVNYAPSENVRIGDIYNEWPLSCENKICQEKIEEVSNSSKVDLRYDIEYPIVTGSIEFLWKKELFLLDIGVGFNSGPYAFTTMGLNTSHFEIGVAAGAWFNSRDYEYEGLDFTANLLFLDQNVKVVYGDSHSAGTTMLGLYMGLYFGKFGFEVSSSLYDVDLEVDNFSTIPMISTTYTTASYRLNKHWTFKAGTVLLMGSRMDPYLSGIGGVSYSL